MQNKRIILEVGKKYNLSPQEAQELYDQYWMEFVVRKLASLKYDYVNILGLGAFIANPKMVKKRHDGFETNPHKKIRLAELYIGAYKSKFKGVEPETWAN
jgi:hypothetical protein